MLSHNLKNGSPLDKAQVHSLHATKVVDSPRLSVPQLQFGLTGCKASIWAYYTVTWKLEARETDADMLLLMLLAVLGAVTSFVSDPGVLCHLLASRNMLTCELIKF